MSDEMKYEYGDQSDSTFNQTQNTGYGEPVHYESHQYQDPYKNTPPEEPSGMAIASLVLGIISVVISCAGYNIITAILAIIFGAIHLGKRRSRRGMAIAGIVLGIISIALFVIVIVIAAVAIGTSPDFMNLYNDMLNEL